MGGRLRLQYVQLLTRQTVLFTLLLTCLGNTSLGAEAKKEIKPFTTDGCSVFPDGTREQQSLWVNCCIRHDLAYWKGGTEEERLRADIALKDCVTEIGRPELAKLMLAGVRFGGSPYYPMPYRWGYGWPYLRGYEPLTAEEKEEIRRKLEMLQIMIKSIGLELQYEEEK
jgi:hypothetical protein